MCGCTCVVYLLFCFVFVSIKCFLYGRHKQKVHFLKWNGTDMFHPACSNPLGLSWQRCSVAAAACAFCSCALLKLNVCMKCLERNASPCDSITEHWLFSSCWVLSCQRQCRGIGSLWSLESDHHIVILWWHTVGLLKRKLMTLGWIK